MKNPSKKPNSKPNPKTNPKNTNRPKTSPKSNNSKITTKINAQPNTKPPKSTNTPTPKPKIHIVKILLAAIGSAVAALLLIYLVFLASLGAFTEFGQPFWFKHDITFFGPQSCKRPTYLTCDITDSHYGHCQCEKANSTDPNDKMVLLVEKSSWSGWVEDYEPEKETITYDVQLQHRYVVETREHSLMEKGEWRTEDEEVFSFKITKINDDSIDIHTFQVFSEGEDGIDLNSKQQDFTIKIDQPTTLTTPTMDAGDIFTLTLTRLQKIRFPA